MNINSVLPAVVVPAMILAGCATSQPPPPPPAPAEPPPVVATPPPPPKVEAPKPKQKQATRPKPKVQPAPAPLRVLVKGEGGNAGMVERMAVAAMKNDLSRAGYVVNGDGEPDIVITTVATRSVFDRTGGSVVYDGALRVHIAVKGVEPSFVEEKTFRARGKRGMDASEAERNLADVLTPQVGAWSLSSAARGRERLRAKSEKR